MAKKVRRRKAHTVQIKGLEVVIRRALPDDYPAFSRLFPEMQVDDPIPGLDVWVSVLAPSTWVADRAGEVLGYCYVQEYVDTGYVRNVVVSPGARRTGLGRALMQVTADHLKARGKTSWRLNVKSDNQAALALYRRLGMEVKYPTTVLLFPWAALSTLPTGQALVHEVTAARDAVLERQFDIPHGQLASARGSGRWILEARAKDGSSFVGLAVFDPKFPGAFPFRVDDLDALAPLLRAMRQHVPSDESVNLVVEDDEQLVSRLMGVGASTKFETLHMAGALHAADVGS